MIELELPVPISENQYRRTIKGMKFPIISDAGRKYKENLKMIAAQRNLSTIPGNVSVTVEFYPPDRRRRDIDNIFKCLFDAITEAGLIEDDSYIKRLSAEKMEPAEPGFIYLKIEPFKKERPE